MFIFLYGEDTFRSRRKLNQLIEQYKLKNKSGLNFIRFADFNLDKFKMAVSVSPMFQEKKFIILENIFKQKSDEILLNYLKQVDLERDSEVIVLIWEGGVIDKKNEFFKLLAKKPNMFEEFASLTGVELSNWVKKEINIRGGQINDEALKKLIVLSGDDSDKLDNEINKLIAFRAGEIIDIKDVELFISGKIASNIFDTVDALGNLNKQKAMALVQKHLSEGEDAFYLLSMLAYQFRILLCVKNAVGHGLTGGAIIKKMGLHPFVYKKSLAQAKNFTLEQLKNIYERLLKIDISTKTGKVEARTAIEVLIAEL